MKNILSYKTCTQTHISQLVFGHKIKTKNLINKILISLFIMTLSLNTYAGDDDLIFANSFEIIEIAPLSFVYPQDSEVVDHDLIRVRVKASSAQGQLESVSINGISTRVIFQNTDYAEFEADIPLNQGLNQLTAVAKYLDQVLEVETKVSFIRLNQITITSHIDQQTLGEGNGSNNDNNVFERTVNISGTLSSATIVNVEINQQTAEFDNDSFKLDGFIVHEGNNLISVLASDQFGRKSTAQITLYVDHSAPFLSVSSLDGRITSTNKIDIMGTVNDAIQASFNTPVVDVMVTNTSNGSIVNASVEGINYHASDITLSVGNNNILISAMDASGNLREIQAQVMRIAVGSKRITQLFGNRQSALANSPLAQSLSIAAIDKDGLPLVNIPIHFDILKGTATISPIQNSTSSNNDGVNLDRNLTVNTDTSGQAQVWVTLGSQAGLANNIIHAWSSGIAQDAYFSASTTVGDAAKILIEGAAGTQYAQTDSQPVEALTATVLDENNNPISNYPVIFRINQGLAYFTEDSAPHAEILDAGQGLRTLSDKNGLASVRPYLSSVASTVKIETTIENQNSELITGALFHIIVLQRQQGATRFGGIVLDQYGGAISGVELSIAHTDLITLSNETGHFKFNDNVPAGKIDLFVDGSAIEVQQGDEIIQYPSLHLETAIIQGQNNQLPHAINLPPVHYERAQMVGGDEDVTLSIAGFEGYELIVKANSVTFADGSKQGLLVANPVHNDRLPMVPPGTAGRFMTTGGTLQPAGTRFDPPIEVHIPNTEGLKPGHVMPLVQWDHDLAQFLPMGIATVNENGSQLVTNKGSGISKAGWFGGGGNPNNDNGSNNNNGGGGNENEPDDGPSGDDTPESDNNPNTDLDPIIMATGEFISSVTDLKIKSRGFDFSFTRTYRSKYTYNGPLGASWNHNHNDRLIFVGGVNGNVVRCASGSGRIDTYRRNAQGVYITPDSLYKRLTKTADNVFTLRDRFGNKSIFNQFGRLTERTDRQGNRMSYQYDQRFRLQTITDTLGRDIRLEYFDNNRIRKLIDFTGREVQYTYDANGDLASVRSPLVTNTSTDNDFPDGKIINYSYSSGFSQEFLNHNLLTITDPKGQTYLKNTYGETGYQIDRVIIQQEGEQNQTYEISYVDVIGGDPEQPNVPDNQVTVVDRAGNIEVHIHNARGNLLEKREQTNRNINPNDADEYVTLHKYDINGERIQSIYPEGNRVIYTYDSNSVDFLQRGNLLQIIEQAGPRGGSQTSHKRQMRYEPLYNQMRSITDPRGFDEDFIPPNGGITSPERYTSNYLFDYQESSSLGALAIAAGVNLQDVTELLTNAGIEIGLGDINGDSLSNQVSGNKIQSQKPSPRLIDGSQQRVIMDYQYNRFGQVTQNIDPEGNVKQYQYFAELSPDGTGNTSQSSRLLAIDTGGYLRQKTLDSSLSPRRDNLPLERVSSHYLYSSVGKVLRHTDGRGNSTNFQRNALDQIIKVTASAPFLYEQEIHYDANNNIIRREIQNVNTNGPGLDESVTITYEFDILDNPTASHYEVATGQLINNHVSYDANENVIGFIQGEGNLVTQEFDERDLLYAHTRGANSAAASTVHFSYDGNSNAIAYQDAQDNNDDGLPEIYQLNYDGFDRMINARDAVGNIMIYDYDPIDNKITEQSFGQRNGASPDNNSGAGNVLLSENRRLYDELNRLYQLDYLFQDAEGKSLPDGVLTANDGFVSSQYLYDRSSRLIRRTDDNAHQENFSYDGINRRTSITDALNNQKIYRYDRSHNMVGFEQLELDPSGAFAEERFIWQIQFDELNRATQLTDNLSNITTVSYDSRNNMIARLDPLNNLTAYVYDGKNRVLQKSQHLSQSGAGGVLDTSNATNPDGLINTWVTYDDNSRMTSLIDDSNNSTNYRYDELNRVLEKSYADNSMDQYSYDLDDNLTQLIDPNGSIHSLNYDAINRLINIDINRAAGIAGTTQLGYQYDGLNRRTQLSDNNDPQTPDDDWVINVEYDSINQVLNQLQNGQSVKSLFDGVGNQLEMIYPSGRQISRQYDELDRIKQITEASTDESIADYQYMGFGRVTQRLNGNGTSFRLHDGENLNGYDGVKRVIGLEHLDTTGRLIAAFNYGYDKAGNRRFETERQRNSSGSKLFELDSAYRVKRSAVKSPDDLSVLVNNNIINTDLQVFTAGLNKDYTLDGVGNWSQLTQSGINPSTTGYTSNQLNQYEQIGDDAQSHDDDGNLTTDDERILSYDALDRLIKVEEAGITLASFTYDALSRRVTKTNAEGTISYYYDRYRAIEEQNEQGRPLRSYVQGRYLDELIQMKTQGNTYYYHASVQHSIAAITDENGVVVERYRYGDFGQTEIIDASGAIIPQSQIGNTFGYTGRRLDSETGYYYYRARFFDPKRGRFLNRDPIGYIAGMNLYTYVNNNPLKWIDPLGFDDEKSWADEARDFFDDYVNEQIEEGACDGSFGGALSCAALALEKAAFEVFVADALDVAQDLANGEISLQTAIDLGLVVCKICKFGEKLGDIKDATKKLNNPCNCLVADTQVLTKDGMKSIQDIQVGDIVWAKDPITGISEWKAVTSVFTNTPKPIYVITLQVAGGETQTIESTDDHPFYVVAKGWIKTINLQQGYQIETKDGLFVTVSSVELTQQEDVTYNFSVDGFHTYYVTEFGILVHNGNKPCNLNLESNKDFPELDFKNKVHGDLNLVKPNDFGNYDSFTLKKLLKDLKISVQERIRKNSELGPQGNHGLRQGQEQDLIKSLEKYLKDNG